MRLIITDRNKIIFSMYRACEVSVHRACCEQAPWRGTSYTGSRAAGVTTRSPKMVTECLLTRSMFIKMNYHFMVCACACICTVVFTVSQRPAATKAYFILFFLIGIFEKSLVNSTALKKIKVMSLLESLKIDKISKLTVKSEASLFYLLNLKFK